jgi:hypothetical protein
MSELKQQTESGLHACGEPEAASPRVQAWDLPFYMVAARRPRSGDRLLASCVYVRVLGGQGRLKAREHSLDSRVLSSYLGLDDCTPVRECCSGRWPGGRPGSRLWRAVGLHGLQLVAERVFGLELRPSPMPAEDWTPG